MIYTIQSNGDKYTKTNFSSNNSEVLNAFEDISVSFGCRIESGLS